MLRIVFTVILLIGILVSCQERHDMKIQQPKEDLRAKELLQGIWIDSDEDQPSFRIKGDSMFYPDTTSQPARFRIVADTLIIDGANSVKYPIVRQTEYTFNFVNQNGETVRLVKSEDKEDADFFFSDQPAVLNQLQTIKRDTVIFSGNERYHCYVQVNPTRQKVLKSTYNDDGVEVDNVYYDNSIRLILFHGAHRLYQHDFHREDFRNMVPNDFLKQSVLSDLVYSRHNVVGVVYEAQLAIPDSQSSFVVDVTVTYNGRMSMKVSDSN